jgi:hypothetical protein
MRRKRGRSKMISTRGREEIGLRGIRIRWKLRMMSTSSSLSYPSDGNGVHEVEGSHFDE